jgi:hypothetical protein
MPGRACCTWRQARPKYFEGGVHAGLQSGIAVKRPDQERAKDGLAENMGDLSGGKVAANFTAHLAELNDLSVKSVSALLKINHGLADGGSRKIGLEKGPDNGRVASGLLGHALAKRPQEVGHGNLAAACALDGGFQFCELHFSEGDEDVVLAGEVVEKRAFADVGGFGDVLDSGLGKAFPRKEIEGCAEEAFANLGAAALAAARTGADFGLGEPPASFGMSSQDDPYSNMTISHCWLRVK